MSVEPVTKLAGGERLYALYPGLLAAAVVAPAASWLSQHYAAPVMLFALLIGVAFHWLYEEGRCIPGIEFASRQVLRVDVAFLGVRITVEQIASLGAIPVCTVVLGVVTTILVGTLMAERLGIRYESDRRVGWLRHCTLVDTGRHAAVAVRSAKTRLARVSTPTAALGIVRG